MSGLNLGVGGGIRFGGAGTTIASAPPATVSQVVYGGGSGVQSPSGIQYWHLGVAVPVAATAWLIFLRWTLPG
jgi:Na+/H+ antiporter NhaD/arsenite permease-like protein